MLGTSSVYLCRVIS